MTQKILRAPQSLFDPAGICPPDAYCEAFESPGMARAHWQAVIDSFNAAGMEALNQRQRRVKRIRHEDGATYNPFDDPGGRGTPWALDMIPMALPPDAWAGLEAGLIQRARLLDRVLADVYGPQDTLKKRLLPPALVYANPAFLRTCHGIDPGGNRFLTFYGVDVYRTADGRFRVLRDYGANPAGLGYALENRIVISRVLPDLYHQNRTCRLAPFFNAFQRYLARQAGGRHPEPGIVLLTPGPDSRIYFEHAFLSRYLGYPLVEGQDLTVRNGRVFLKKLAGLEPVDAIFRQTADTGSDPFALRRGTATGVAGLIQAAREHTVDTVNPIGSGFVDTPALAVFLAPLCRHLLGEDLILDSHPAWWCGDAEGLARTLASAGQLDIGPALDPNSSICGADPQIPPMDAIQARPHAFMAREFVSPAVVPVWNGGGVAAQPTLMRFFVCADQQGFTVMRGGLAITAPDIPALMGGCLERQQSKDIWILSDAPVAPFSLMSGLERVAAFNRGSDLPSRVADHLMWLGRYLERAEGLIRLLRCIFRRISSEARIVEIPELHFLLEVLRKANTIAQAPGESGDVPMVRQLAATLDAVLYEPDRPGSVVAILKRVQETARNVRDRLSLDCWRVIDRLDRFAEAKANDTLELMDDTLFALSAFSGLAMESMTRGHGWRFMDMGRRVERALNQISLIRTGLADVSTETRAVLEALLEVCDSIMTYRARYRSAFQTAPVLDLLLMDASNPKSLAFQFNQLADHAAHLPRPDGQRQISTLEEDIAAEMLAAVRRMDLAGLSSHPDNAKRRELVAFLDSMAALLNRFARQIAAHYLSRVQTTPHFSASNGRQP